LSAGGSPAGRHDDLAHPSRGATDRLGCEMRSWSWTSMRVHGPWQIAATGFPASKNARTKAMAPGFIRSLSEPCPRSSYRDVDSGGERGGVCLLWGGSRHGAASLVSWLLASRARQRAGVSILRPGAGRRFPFGTEAARPRGPVPDGTSLAGGVVRARSRWPHHLVGLQLQSSQVGPERVGGWV
jgi:hypothetical protein